MEREYLSSHKDDMAQTERLERPALQGAIQEQRGSAREQIPFPSGALAMNSLSFRCRGGFPFYLDSDSRGGRNSGREALSRRSCLTSKRRSISVTSAISLFGSCSSAARSHRSIHFSFCLPMKRASNRTAVNVFKHEAFQSSSANLDVVSVRTTLSRAVIQFSGHGSGADYSMEWV